METTKKRRFLSDPVWILSVFIFGLIWLGVFNELNTYYYSVPVGDLVHRWNVGSDNINTENEQKALSFLESNFDGPGQWSFDYNYNLFKYEGGVRPEDLLFEIESIINDESGYYLSGWLQFTRDFEEVHEQLNDILNTNSQPSTYYIALMDPYDSNRTYFMGDIDRLPGSVYDFLEEANRFNNNLFYFGVGKEDIGIWMLVTPIFLIIGFSSILYIKDLKKWLKEVSKFLS